MHNIIIHNTFSQVPFFHCIMTIENFIAASIDLHFKVIMVWLHDLRYQCFFRHWGTNHIKIIILQKKVFRDLNRENRQFRQLLIFKQWKCNVNSSLHSTVLGEILCNYKYRLLIILPFWKWISTVRAWRELLTIRPLYGNSGKFNLYCIWAYSVFYSKGKSYTLLRIYSSVLRCSCSVCVSSSRDKRKGLPVGARHFHKASRCVICFLLSYFPDRKTKFPVVCIGLGLWLLNPWERHHYYKRHCGRARGKWHGN